MPALSHTNSLRWRLYKYRCAFIVMQLQVKQFQTCATSKTIKLEQLSSWMHFKISRARMKAQWDEGGERVLLGDNTGGGRTADFVPLCWGLDFSLTPSLCLYTWPYYSVRTRCQTVRNVTVAQVGDGLYFWIRWISALALYSEVEADRSVSWVFLKARVGTVILNTPRSYLKFSRFTHYPAVTRYTG